MKRIVVAACLCALVLAASLLIAFGQPGNSKTTRAALTATPVSATGASNNMPDVRRDVLIPARTAPHAPTLAAGNWVNSEPLKLEDLRGRVVLLEFWTFGCYNCRNTLPAIKRFDARYRERGLTVIGVHTPEFDREKKLENVRSHVNSLGIRYPVVTDNNGDSWRAFNTQAWPTVVILDKQGRIRFTHIGEGMYDEAEDVIKKLLAE